MSTATGGTAAPRRTASKTAASAAAPAAGAPSLTDRIDLPKAVQVLAEGEVMTPEGLYQFLEALRVLATGSAFYVESAGTQLERAVKKGARASTDGRMTLQQKLELRLVLRKVARAMSAAHDDLFNVARDAMRAYAPMEDFLDKLESESVSRPHRSGRGGFDPFGGR